MDLGLLERRLKCFIGFRCDVELLGFLGEESEESSQCDISLFGYFTMVAMIADESELFKESFFVESVLLSELLKDDDEEFRVDGGFHC